MVHDACTQGHEEGYCCYERWSHAITFGDECVQGDDPHAAFNDCNPFVGFCYQAGCSSCDSVRN